MSQQMNGGKRNKIQVKLSKLVSTNSFIIIFSQQRVNAYLTS